MIIRSEPWYDHQLPHWGQVMHIFVSKIVHHWFIIGPSLVQITGAKSVSGQMLVFCKLESQEQIETVSMDPGVWINSMWPSDVLWHHRTWSTLVQVMTCCLTAPSHYLTQLWLTITDVFWHSPESNFTGNTQDTYPWYGFAIANDYLR